MLESGHELSARFVLLRRIGAGGSGSVWLAQDRERDCRVAIKILADDLSRNPRALRALQSEFERSAGLDHPNIVRVEGFHRSTTHVWIAMEYVCGGELSELRGRPYAHILQAVIPIANALVAAHCAGYVHRDLKAANVLLMPDGSPRLIDFGTAVPSGHVVAEDSGRGSPYSMSPQQLDGAPACVADDVYAFGAMLYELISGQPPFYPDIDPQRIRFERPSAMITRETLPQNLIALVDRCLQKSPMDRPADMTVIERELTAILDHETTSIPNTQPETVMQTRIDPPDLSPPRGQGEPLRGEWRRSSHAGPSESDLRRQGFRRGLGAAALVLGLASVVVVFFLLPKWVEKKPAAEVNTVVPAVVSPPETAPVEKKELDFAALARAKQEAEEIRAPLEERLQKLRDRGVEQWGEQQYTLAAEKLAAADADFAAREYISAAEHFTAIEPILAGLEQRATEVLKTQLGAGAVALREGRSADAAMAFELANKIDPENAVAERGLKRARTLDEVLALVASAERFEQDTNMAAAADGYRKALELDAEAPRASEGIARVQARIAGDAFASAMARGFNAIAKNDYAAARNSFEAARKIRPNAPEIDQALKQIEQEERTRIIAAKLDKARAQEAKEQWSDALQEYRSVLQLDPTVAFASEGVARVQPRAELNQQLEIYLTQPERLFSGPVRSSARETLQQASMVNNAGPVLTRQMATLRDWLARAEVPVQVALQSDNLTQVVIYRVGQLGAFERRSLDLAPGNYTVVGTRPGYRDVRREITVMPGAQLPPVVIRCEDKI